MRTEVIRSVEDMEALSRHVAESLVPGERATVLALHGDLGAGKTTFTQGLATALGVTTTVPSPTFVVMRTYALTGSRFKTLVHIDAYRIEDETELAPLRLEGLLSDPTVLMVIEWPERVPALTREAVLTFDFSHGREGERIVSHPIEYAND